MPTMVLDQATTPYPDGEFTNGSEGQQLYASAGRIGYKIEDGRWEIWHQYLRFTIPVAFNNGRQITSCKLKLYLDYDPGRAYDPIPDANIGTHVLNVKCYFPEIAAQNFVPYGLVPATAQQAWSHYYFNAIGPEQQGLDSVTLNGEWVNSNPGTSIDLLNMIPELLQEPPFYEYENVGYRLNEWLQLRKQYGYNDAAILSVGLYLGNHSYNEEEERVVRLLTFTRIEDLISHGSSDEMYRPVLELEYFDLPQEQYYEDTVTIVSEHVDNYASGARDVIDVVSEHSMSKTVVLDHESALDIVIDVNFLQNETLTFYSDLIIDSEHEDYVIEPMLFEDVLVVDHSYILDDGVEDYLDMVSEHTMSVNKTFYLSVESKLDIMTEIADSLTNTEQEVFLYIEQSFKLNTTHRPVFQHDLDVIDTFTFESDGYDDHVSAFVLEVEHRMRNVYTLVFESFIDVQQTVSIWQVETCGQAQSVYSTVSLSYLLDTVVLPSPDFGDRLVLNKQRIQRETLSGDTIVYADPFWTTVETLRFSFSNLTLDTVNELLDLLRLSQGRPVQYVDHFGTFYTGIVASPSTEIVTQKEDCSYTAQFDLEII